MVPSSRHEKIQGRSANLQDSWCVIRKIRVDSVSRPTPLAIFADGPRMTRETLAAQLYVVL